MARAASTIRPSRRRKGIGADNSVMPTGAPVPFAVLAPDVQLEFHRLANLIPMMSDAEMSDQQASLAANGLREPIVLFEGKILDGRHRYTNGRAAGIELRVREFGSLPSDGDDPLKFVIDLNLRRRHLTPGQLAMVVADIEGYRHGGRRTGNDDRMTRADAIALVDHAVSPRAVARAAVVRDQGDQALQDAVRGGQVAPSVAAEVAAGLSIDDQRARLAAAADLSKEILRIASELRSEKNKARRAVKVARTVRINAGNGPLDFGGRKFVVAVADPPWRYERPLIGDSDRSIENKYPTMPLVDILAMPVHAHLAEQAVIFLHIPQPMQLCECPADCAVPDGMTYPVAIGRAWGDPYWRDVERRSARLWFVPRAMMIWEKRSPEDIATDSGPIGMGHYVRTDHECVVIMTRGGLALPEFKPRSVFHVRSRGELEHSEKPAEIYDAIRRMYQDYVDAGLALALFERETARPGFVCWGNEVPADWRAAA